MKHLAIVEQGIRTGNATARRDLAYAMRPGGMTPGGLTFGQAAAALGVSVGVLVAILRPDHN